MPIIIRVHLYSYCTCIVHIWSSVWPVSPLYLCLRFVGVLYDHSHVTVVWSVAGLGFLQALQQWLLLSLHWLRALFAQRARLPIEEGAPHAQKSYPSSCALLPAPQAPEVNPTHQATREGQCGLLHFSPLVGIVGWAGRWQKHTKTLFLLVGCFSIALEAEGLLEAGCRVAGEGDIHLACFAGRWGSQLFTL